MQDGRPALSVPFLLSRLRELRVVDEAQEQALARDGILTLPDLELAIAERRSPVVNASLRDAAGTLRREVRPLLLGRAWDILDRFVPAFAQCSEIQSLEPSGAVRRAEP